jgi:hypothetical protein
MSCRSSSAKLMLTSAPRAASANYFNTATALLPAVCDSAREALKRVAASNDFIVEQFPRETLFFRLIVGHSRNGSVHVLSKRPELLGVHR